MKLAAHSTKQRQISRCSLISCLLFPLLLAAYTSHACQDKNDPATVKKDWWQTAQFYQIYPRSFMDSNGDGIGDLKGITLKLQYLKDIGVTAAWLSPIFTSPMVDFGYDISDFYGIQPEYGTIEDFRALVSRANELGIKIILDFVPNHSSTDSEWFKKSVKRERGYEDYYVWADGKKDASGKRMPPSNWLQAFRGSAWEWNEERQQYYLHQFAVQQADLNYRNPAVVEQMKRILRYWLDQGVAGFRIDAVPVLFEVKPNKDGTYPDEEVSGLTDDKDARNYLKMDLIENQPETIDMVYQWRELVDDYQRIHGGETRVLLIETYAEPWYTMQMYGNTTVEGAHLPFNFNFISELANGVTAPKVKMAVDHWLKNMPAGRTANWVIGNHDNRRAASRYGIQRTDAMNMLVMLLPGASVTYQGEELGMTDGDITWEESVDPAATNSNPNIYQKFTRDPERTPFHWNAGINAGFSTASKTWLPVAKDYKTVNVEIENSTPNSHLAIYKQLVNLRKTSKALQNGYEKYDAINEGIFVLKRFLAGEPSVLFVANLGEGQYEVNLQTAFDRNLPETLTVKLTSQGSSRSVGSTISIHSLSLNSGEALILTTA